MLYPSDPCHRPRCKKKKKKKKTSVLQDDDDDEEEEEEKDDEEEEFTLSPVVNILTSNLLKP
jgi:hypothetical protein